MGTTVDTETVHDLNILECHNSRGIRYFGSCRFFHTASPSPVIHASVTVRKPCFLTGHVRASKKSGSLATL